MSHAATRRDQYQPAYRRRDRPFKAGAALDDGRPLFRQCSSICTYGAQIQGRNGFNWACIISV